MKLKLKDTYLYNPTIQVSQSFDTPPFYIKKIRRFPYLKDFDVCLRLIRYEDSI